MNRNIKSLLAVALTVAICGCSGSGSKVDPSRLANRNVDFDQYFTELKADAAPAKPDEKGFIRRWTILEPINKPNSGNTVFTDSYIERELTKEYFPGMLTATPEAGTEVIIESEAASASRGRGGFGGFGGGAPQGGAQAGAARPAGAPAAGAAPQGAQRPQGAPAQGAQRPQGAPAQGAQRPQGAPAGAPQGAPQGGFPGMGMGMGMGMPGAGAAPAAPATVKDTLTWHSVDSKLFNIKLIRFAQGTSNGQKRYGLIFHAYTIINVDKDYEDIRLAAGSNASSIWWVNGEKVLTLQADRRMVADDGMSKRVTLKKGRNVIHAAVINGPGMSDMCARLYSEDGTIFTNYTITNK